MIVKLSKMLKASRILALLLLPPPPPPPSSPPPPLLLLIIVDGAFMFFVRKTLSILLALLGLSSGKQAAEMQGDFKAFTF